MARLAGLVLAALIAASGAMACERPANHAAIAAEVIERTNVERGKKRRAALTRADRLTDAAQSHACFMAATDKMSHTGKGGSSVGARVSGTGYRWGMVAENVAFGQATAQAVMASWVTSKGHRKNLMHRKARDIGIGIARKNGRLYWAMVLAAPR